MNPKIYQQIFAEADPIIKQYRDDLLKHDWEFIENAPDDLPFLHYTRDSGTHIVALHQPQHLDELFQGTEAIRYLFGSVTRPRFIQKKLEEHDAVMESFGSGIELILYYDPKTGLEPVTPDRARAITFVYSRCTR